MSIEKFLFIENIFIVVANFSVYMQPLKSGQLMISDQDTFLSQGCQEYQNQGQSPPNITPEIRTPH